MASDDDIIWPKRTMFNYDDDLIKDELVGNIVQKQLQKDMEEEIFKKMWLTEPQWQNNPHTHIGTSAVDTTTSGAAKVQELRQNVQRLEHRLREMERDELRKRVEEQDEELLRVTHPAVKDAWEKYRMVIRLAKKG